MTGPDIKADIHQIGLFRDAVGVSGTANSLTGTLATYNNQYGATLTQRAPQLGQPAGGHAFAEAIALADKYPQAAAALIGPHSATHNLILHLERLHDAADNAVNQYTNGVLTEAN